MLGHFHSQPGLHVACELQVGHPCEGRLVFMISVIIIKVLKHLQLRQGGIGPESVVQMVGALSCGLKGPGWIPNLGIYEKSALSHVNVSLSLSLPRTLPLRKQWKDVLR